LISRRLSACFVTGRQVYLRWPTIKPINPANCPRINAIHWQAFVAFAALQWSNSGISGWTIVWVIRFSGRLLDARISGISKVYTHLCGPLGRRGIRPGATRPKQPSHKARAQSTAYQQANDGRPNYKWHVMP